MRILGDITNPKVLYLKAGLFLVAGLLAAAGILAQNPTLTTLVLLAVAIWSFCRLYYFMFYVVEKYADPGYRFAGISSFLLYLARKRKAGR